MFYVVSQLIVYYCLKDGITVSGQIAIFTAISPFAFLLIFMIRNFFLDGAIDKGLYYLFYPDFSKIFTLKIWAEAASQVFF
jgi:NSS family neurotransmitter:Na+ symporter